MSKKLIRLTEEDLHRIVKESLNRVLRENNQDLAFAARKKLIDHIKKNGIVLNSLGNYKGQGYASSYFGTDDGWIFDIEDFMVDIILDYHSGSEPQTWDNPGSDWGPEGHIENLSYDEDKLNVWCQSPNGEVFDMPFDDELMQLTLDNYSVDDEALEEALYEIEQEEADYNDYLRDVYWDNRD